MLTATVVNVALPVLALDLDASSSQQQWILNGYLLTIAALILIGGSLGDRFGRVRVYRIGVAWFALASLFCALAPNVEVLIAMRLLQGVGGALLTPGSLAIIEATLRPADRGRGVGQWSGLGGVAGAIGPLVGGLLIELSWRWVFVINVPVAVAVLIAATKIPESFDEEADGSALDLKGAALTALALGAASYALIEGPNGGWSALEVGAALGSLAAVAGLVVVEPRTAHPLLPLELFADRTFAAANVVTLLVYGGMGVVFFLVSIQLQLNAGFSPLASGAALLPITVMMLLLSSRSGELAQRIGPRLPLTIGPLLIAAGMVLFARIGPDASFLADVLPGVMVFALGLAASVAPVTATALGAVPENRAGAASGVNNAVARTGQLLAVAAIPPLVGLTGDALSDPVQLDDSFGTAMFVGAALVALGGVASFVFLRADDLESEPEPVGDGSGQALDADADASAAASVRFHTHCGVDGPHPQPRLEEVP